MSRYGELGVDVRKRGIEVFDSIIQNLFPGAFCTVVPDIAGRRGYGTILHTDGAGSKPVQSYLHYKETGDINWFKGLAQDTLAMNLDDFICVGVHPLIRPRFAFVDYVAINGYYVPKKEFLKTIETGLSECFYTLIENGYSGTYRVKYNPLFAGGETADLPDQLRTVDISGTTASRTELSKALIGDKIQPRDKIIGIRSDGRAKYEKTENSGIMCNWITLARHATMSHEYQIKYPEIFEPKVEAKLQGEGRHAYYGNYKFDQYLDELGMTIGEAILSPTRLFAPIILALYQKFGEDLTGFVHNTGGGGTKILRLGTNLHFKKKLMKINPITRVIQKESKESWKSVFSGSNTGYGFDVICRPNRAEEILSIPESFGVEAEIIGCVEKGNGKNKLTIESPDGKFQYPPFD